MSNTALYRQNQSERLWKHRIVLENLLTVFGEIKNNRAYKSGSMGAYDPVDLDNRINNVLIAADALGIKTEKLLELATDSSLPLPDLAIQKLTQYSVVSEFRYRMWKGPSSYGNSIYNVSLKHSVTTYRDARRLLRTRYYMIPDDGILEFLPDNFPLKD